MQLNLLRVSHLNNSKKDKFWVSILYCHHLQVLEKLQLQKNKSKISEYKNFISHTTRKPRSNEIDGVDYHFVSKEKFKNL